MKAEAQVLPNETIEAQFQDSTGRAGTTRFDPEQLLDKQEIEDICRLLNEIYDRTNMKWSPVFDEGQPHARALQRPVPVDEDSLWRTCNLLELRDVLRDCIEMIGSWLARARDLSPNPDKAEEE